MIARRLRAAVAKCTAIGAVLCGLAAGSPHPPQARGEVPEQFAKIDARIAKAVDERHVASIAVGVARDGQVIWEAAYGMADREAGVSATPHTPYSLASISKPITATALMMLVERGAIDLDQPIEKYLSGAALAGRAASSNGATVRLVANHTAGLPLHYHFFYADDGRQPPPRAETIERYGILVTAPGERYQYSNLGYGLIDYAIQNAGGQTYDDFMRSQVFEPLGMRDASTPSAAQPGLAARYASDDTPLPFYQFDHPGASAVFASAHDLLCFGSFHVRTPLADQKPVLRGDTLDAMQRPTAATSEKSGYGVGWASARDEQGWLRISHDGGMAGVSTTLILIPEAHLVVTALANSSSGLPARIAEELIAATLGDEKPSAESSPVEFPSSPAQDTSTTTLADLQGKWQGQIETYAGTIPIALEFGDEVRVALGSAAPVVVDKPRVGAGGFRGSFEGELNTEDVNERPYRLMFDLRIRNSGEQQASTLAGALMAMSKPDRKLGNALAHWVLLTRIAP